MRRKLAYTLVLLSILLVFSATYTPTFAADYSKVGVHAGSTADYSCILTHNSTVTKFHTSVLSVSGALVTVNGTYYHSNATVALTEPFLVNVTAPNNISMAFNFVFLTAANLTKNDPIFSGSTGKINDTTTMIVAGANRTVNHLKIAGGQLEDYWDKSTGIMVKLSFYLISGWLNFTMTSTNLWSATGSSGLSTTTLLIVGGVVVLVVIVAGLLLMRRRK